MALATGLSAVAAPALAIAPPKDITLQQDFDELWETIRDRYAYFEEKATDWDRVRAIYLPRLAEVGDDEDKWMRLLGSITDELYDAHTHFAQGVPGLPRWPLSDILAEDSPAGVRVRDRRDGSAAADAGIEVGDLVIAIDGMPFAQAAALRTPVRCADRIRKPGGMQSTRLSAEIASGIASFGFAREADRFATWYFRTRRRPIGRPSATVGSTAASVTSRSRLSGIMIRLRLSMRRCSI
jgi:C-terminal processing protease CtpA/Prc